jgi:hypothetical protein
MILSMNSEPMLCLKGAIVHRKEGTRVPFINIGTLASARRTKQGVGFATANQLLKSLFRCEIRSVQGVVEHRATQLTIVFNACFIYGILNTHTKFEVSKSKTVVTRERSRQGSKFICLQNLRSKFIFKKYF